MTEQLRKDVSEEVKQRNGILFSVCLSDNLCAAISEAFFSAQNGLPKHTLLTTLQKLQSVAEHCCDIGEYVSKNYVDLSGSD